MYQSPFKFRPACIFIRYFNFWPKCSHFCWETTTFLPEMKILEIYASRLWLSWNFYGKEHQIWCFFSEVKTTVSNPIFIVAFFNRREKAVCSSTLRTFNDVSGKRCLSRVGNIWFLPPLVLSKWEDLAFSVCIIFEKSVFIFQFLNNKMHKCVKQNIIVHSTFQKLINKHTFLKNYTNWES